MRRLPPLKLRRFETPRARSGSKRRLNPLAAPSGFAHTPVDPSTGRPMPKAAWSALVDQSTNVMRPELIKLRSALLASGLPEDSVPTMAEVSVGGKVLGGILAASPFPDMAVYSHSDREAGDVAADVVGVLFAKTSRDPITVSAQNLVAGLLSAARERVREKRDAAEKFVRDVDKENERQIAAANALRSAAALAERDAKDAEEDEDEPEGSPESLHAPASSGGSYDERVRAMIEYLDDREYDDLLDEADTRNVPRGTFSRAVFNATTSANEKKRENWIRTLAKAMVNAQDASARPAPPSPAPATPSARQRAPTPRAARSETLPPPTPRGRVLVSAEDDEPEEPPEVFTGGLPGHVSSGRSARALERLQGFEKNIATSRWYVGGVERKDVRPSAAQVAACSKDVLIFTFGPDIKDASAQVWIKGCLTDTFTTSTGRRGYTAALQYVKRWIGLNDSGKPRQDAKKSRLSCRVLAASYGNPSAEIGDGLVVIREAPRQVAKEMVPLDLKTLAEEGASEFEVRRNNPRGGQGAKYADVLRKYGPGGFAIPQKAPYVGSFPLYPIARARFALAVVASPVYDDRPEVRDQVIRSAVREHPALRTEARSVSETVKSRSLRRR